VWKALPDVALIHDVSFKGMDAADIAAAVRVLQTATERLETYIETSGSPLKLRYMGTWLVWVVNGRAWLGLRDDFRPWLVTADNPRWISRTLDSPSIRALACTQRRDGCPKSVYMFRTTHTPRAQLGRSDAEEAERHARQARAGVPAGLAG